MKAIKLSFTIIKTKQIWVETIKNYLKQRQFPEAFMLANQALGYAASEQEQTFFLIVMGIASILIGENQEALTYFERALNLVESKSDKKSLETAIKRCGRKKFTSKSVLVFCNYLHFGMEIA